jgi:hypothetical protein
LEMAVDLAIASAPCILALSGDLIEWPMRFLEQEEWLPILDLISKACDRLWAAGCTLALCSGNHDTWASAGAVPWFGLSHPGLVTDAIRPFRASHKVSVGDESAVVTCFPWLNDDGPVSLSAVMNFAEAGRILRKSSPNSPWIWLYHSAPGGTPVGTAAVEDLGDVLLEVASAYRPDLVLCGHIHTSPWMDGGLPFWTEPKSGVAFSNPGRRTTGVSISIIDIGTGDGMKRMSFDWRPGA